MVRKIILSSYEPINNPVPGGPLNRRVQVDAQYDWPEGLIQGGRKGVVLSAAGNYRTAFVEAFVDGTFIRGEGETVEEAETACWEKYLARTRCEEHEWESRGYKNGAGFCRKCNTFNSKVFTGEQLGQFCVVCNVGTTYHFDADTFWCEEHVPFRAEREEMYNLMEKQYTAADEDGKISGRVSELWNIIYARSV